MKAEADRAAIGAGQPTDADGNKLKFQRGATAKSEGEARNHRGENRHHVVTARPARENRQPLTGLWKFEQGQAIQRTAEVDAIAGEVKSGCRRRS